MALFYPKDYFFIFSSSACERKRLGDLNPLNSVTQGNPQTLMMITLKVGGLSKGVVRASASDKTEEPLS